MKNYFKSTLPLILMLVLNSNTKAQTNDTTKAQSNGTEVKTWLVESDSKNKNDKREIGIRFSGLNNYNFVYKKAKVVYRKGIPETKYRRYTLGMFNIGIIGAENSIGTISAAFTFGTEYRKPIAPNLKFIHGFEPAFSFDVISSTYSVSAGLGYVLGFQYDFSDKFYMNIETIPSVNLNISTVPSLRAGFRSNAAMISLVYKFKKQGA